MNQFPPRPQSIQLSPFQIFTKIPEYIRSFVFITGVVDTRKRLFTSVAVPETFPLLRALLNLLKESLGRSKPATNLMQAQ